jgi:hypothetical protein
MMLATSVVFVGFGLFEIYNGIARIAFFLLPVGIVMGVSGLAYLRIAKRKEHRDNSG